MFPLKKIEGAAVAGVNGSGLDQLRVWPWLWLYSKAGSHPLGRMAPSVDSGLGWGLRQENRCRDCPIFVAALGKREDAFPYLLMKSCPS